jgi:ADP-ribose pyrophosphatase YjhB (NUDIX family)
MKKQPLTLQEFENIYSKVPRFNVEVIVRTKGGIALSKRSIEPCIGQWHIPGGTVYFKETPEEAVLRVTEEELGLQVTIVKILGVISYPKLHSEGYFGWPLGVVYEVAVEGGSLRGSYQGEEVGYFDSLPANIIEDQKDFLIKHGLL